MYRIHIMKAYPVPSVCQHLSGSHASTRPSPVRHYCCGLLLGAGLLAGASLPASAMEGGPLTPEGDAALPAPPALPASTTVTGPAAYPPPVRLTGSHLAEETPSPVFGLKPGGAGIGLKVSAGLASGPAGSGFGLRAPGMTASPGNAGKTALPPLSPHLAATLNGKPAPGNGAGALAGMDSMSGMAAALNVLPMPASVVPEGVRAGDGSPPFLQTLSETVFSLLSMPLLAGGLAVLAVSGFVVWRRRFPHSLPNFRAVQGLIRRNREHPPADRPVTLTAPPVAPDAADRH